MLLLVIVVTLIILAYIAVMVVRLLRYNIALRVAAKMTKPYIRVLEDASSHILVLGDSTMYGAGTKDPERTVGGLLAAKYPKASIETLAVNGARVKDLHAQLGGKLYQQYDLILIGIGGNDIVRMSRYSALQRELVGILNETNTISSRVVLCHCVNIGNIGFFLFPLNHLYDYRTRRLSELYKQIVAKLQNVTYVNFYRPLHDDHYDKTTRKHFLADDGFHSNDYANEYFFDLIWQDVKKSKSELSSSRDL